MHALIADDDEEMRALYRIGLERAGWTVATAADGPRALALLGAEEVDALVLDFTMPGMTGLDLLRALAAQHARLPLTVVLSNAVVCPAVVEEVLHLGVRSWLVKARCTPRELDTELQRGLSLPRDHRVEARSRRPAHPRS